MNNPTIKDMSTKELLVALNACRGYDGPNPITRVGARPIAGGAVVAVNATVDEIRLELSSRPHVPSKKEATVLRQLKAKTKQSEEWLRAHPTYSQQLADACYPNRRVVSEDYYKRLARAIGTDVTKMYKIG